MVNMAIEIARRQTTFWEFRNGDSESVRIHFHNKEEAKFFKGFASSISIVEKHPVLLDYEHCWRDIYLAGATNEIDQIANELGNAIEIGSGGWRLPKHYFHGDPRFSLVKGFGLLMRAPVPIAEDCVSILESHDIRFSCLAGDTARWPRQALIVGRSFVVAQSFRTESLA